MLKTLFVIQISTFLNWLLTFRKNGLIRKRRLISKFKTSQPGYLKTTIHMLPNISQSKGNQTMKCGQFIDSNQRNHAENEARSLL